MKEGDFVHYNPFFGEKQNGRIKSINNRYAYVVYQCDGDWGNYQNHTSVLTPLVQLKEGWVGENEPLQKDEKLKST